MSDTNEPGGESVTRRAVLTGMAAAGAAIGSLAAQAGQAPAVNSGTMAGRRFRALVHDDEAGSRYMNLRMLPLDQDRVVVRNLASYMCYSMGQQVLNPPGRVARNRNRNRWPQILGHGGVGIVEAVGSRVRRVQVGDRVIVGNTPYCGNCYNCLRGRSDRCELYGGGPDPWLPVAEDVDGGGLVCQHNNQGGLSDLMIPYEWYCQPVFSEASSVDLSALICTGGCGLGTAFGLAPIEPASDVAVLGCGSLGLSAIQGARIKGASQIIAVDPIAYRRELAVKLGATDALNPWDYFKPTDREPITQLGGRTESDELVKKIRDMCKGGSAGRPHAGGRFLELERASIGPDYVIEAVGGDLWEPAAGAGPDPTGILPLQQAWKLCSASGHLCTTSIAHTDNFTIHGSAWANGQKRHSPGNMNGVNSMRDLPRFARLIEKGQFDAKSLVTETCSLDEVKTNYRKISDRTVIGISTVFPA